MIKYNYIIFYYGESFRYQLKEDKTFIIDSNVGKWELINPIENEVVVIADGNKITVKSGYMWDGSTVIGNYYEDECTMEASLLHDVLYNAYKNPQDIEVPFSLFLADKIMMRHLLKLYKNEGFVKRWLFPHLYYWGLTTVGIPWKFCNNNFYKLKNLGD